MSFKYKLNNETFQSPESTITGSQILINGGLEPAENYELLMKVARREFEPIQLDEEIDLGSPGVEGFSAKPYKNLKVEIDSETVNVGECFLSALDLMKLVNRKHEIYYLKQLKGNKEISYKNDPYHRIGIKQNQKFITCKRNPELTVIIVNAKEHEVKGSEVCYKEVVTLAFPDFPSHPERNYSVTYTNGPSNKPSGILSPGGCVKTRDCMIFKVKFTGQS